ncbi:MAG: hypothetical protein SGARI_001432 [Bacillariaceae sp.]
MFRSPDHVSRPSPRLQKHQVPTEGPISDFTLVIESTAPDEWQRRTVAFQTLVAAIPSGSDYYHQNGHGSPNNSSTNDETTWWNSPPILRHLAIPISELIKDPRSTVVKRSCEYCDQLFSKCQVDARYLLKDLMPAIIQVHGSTVSVIRTYVQNMVVDAISVVPCKMAMPLWLDRLKHDKSRTVREACALYLSKSIDDWSTLMEEGYLSKDIYAQVGTALIKALRDASPQVRQQSRKGLEVFYRLQPDTFDRLVANDRELTRDVRTKKLLQRIQCGEAVGNDDMSVASRVSHRSVASAPVMVRSSGAAGGYRSRAMRNNGGAGTPRRTGLGGGAQRVAGFGRSNKDKLPPPSSVPASQSYDIPTTIGVATTKPRGPPPPQRNITPSTTMDSNDEGTITPIDSPPKMAMAIKPFQNVVTTTTPLKSRDGGGPPPVTTVPPVVLSSAADVVNNQSFDTADTDVSELQPITSTTELKQVAKSRGMNKTTTEPSNSSSHVEDVLPANDSLGGGVETILDIAQMSSDEIANHPNLPEHTKIAHQLLEAHKVHVDQVMEVLKLEMDCLKDFELLLLEQGPKRPTEEEVVEYFESLGVCLEQRSKAAKQLQKQMDRISKGK